jgi:hypothetical protein
MSDARGNGRLTRRGFLRAAAASGLTAATPLAALARAAGPARPEAGPGYGPLAPVVDQNTGLRLLMLPKGFSYTSFGWTGDPLEDGTPTPDAHDGMAVFAAGPGRVRLVRNHERYSDMPFASGIPVYDPGAGGGTTTLEFDLSRSRLLRAWGSLSGTILNCAGGATPEGSWLSCEETIAGPGDEKMPSLEKRHGYVFEVPARGKASAEPLTAMGRFLHEAVAVDPRSGIVYQTEDNQDAGFYRFVPEERGRLDAGGRLEMLAVADQPGFEARGGQPTGASFAAQWRQIEDPDPDDPTEQGRSVFAQGLAAGGAVFRRLEGCYAGNGRIYFTSTSGGDAACGQVWVYDPQAERLSLLFESPHRAVLDYPDCVTVSPRGGILLCEDGEDTEFLHTLTRDGEISPFCQNRVVLRGERNGIYGDFTGAEFAGACFDPSGVWLFVNVQKPGISFAITGPWEQGPL